MLCQSSDRGAAARWYVSTGRERRRHPRKEVDLPAEVQAGDGPRRAVRLGQMSVGGCFVHTDEPAAFGTAITVHVVLPRTRQPLALGAIVRWTSDQGMGVQFGALGARETYELTEFLATVPG
jgi:hypothetical protein